MANLTNNRTNITATAAQILAVKAALQTISTNLPFLLGLTVEERTSLLAINVNNKVFTEDAINIMSNNPALLPSYISLPSMQNDLTLFNQLDELIVLTKQLLERMEDTQMLAGAEAYASALTVYKMIGAASEAGIPGTDVLYAQLRQRFINNGGTGNAPQNPNI